MPFFIRRTINEVAGQILNDATRKTKQNKNKNINKKGVRRDSNPRPQIRSPPITHGQEHKRKGCFYVRSNVTDDDGYPVVFRAPPGLICSSVETVAVASRTLQERIQLPLSIPTPGTSRNDDVVGVLSGGLPQPFTYGPVSIRELKLVNDLTISPVASDGASSRPNSSRLRKQTVCE